MANPITAGFGFRTWGPVLRTGFGACATAPTINIAPGDLVSCTKAGIVSAKLGLVPEIYDAAIIQAAPGATLKILGLVLACFDYKMDPLQYIPVAAVGDATVGGYCLIANHPSQIMMAAVSTALTAANLDLNYDVGSATLSAPDTRTGMSTQYITVTGAAVTVTLPIRLYHQSHPQEDVYSSTYCRMVCGFNPECHQFGSGVMIS